ncbi:MAG TPA: hypothetical protein VGM51_13840 [Armatimonadota bacterium]|jgi:hypothetical protein
MRLREALTLIGAVALGGCSQIMEPGYDPLGGPYDANVERLKAAVFEHESPIEFTISDSRNNRFQPGLSIRAKAAVRAGTRFEVWAVVADEKWRANETEWDHNTVRWCLAPEPGDGTTVAPDTERRRGYRMVAQYRVEKPGVYRLTCRERPRGAESAAPIREESVRIVVE